VYLVMGQNDIEFVRIDFLTHNQYVFGFQNQLKSKKSKKIHIN